MGARLGAPAAGSIWTKGPIPRAATHASSSRRPSMSIVPVARDALATEASCPPAVGWEQGRCECAECDDAPVVPQVTQLPRSAAEQRRALSGIDNVCFT